MGSTGSALGLLSVTSVLTNPLRLRALALLVATRRYRGWPTFTEEIAGSNPAGGTESDQLCGGTLLTTPSISCEAGQHAFTRPT